MKVTLLVADLPNCAHVSFRLPDDAEEGDLAIVKHMLDFDESTVSISANAPIDGKKTKVLDLKGEAFSFIFYKGQWYIT